MSSMVSNEDLLREIERLRTENEVLRLQVQTAKRSERPPYDATKLLNIPEFENVFWAKSGEGRIYPINAHWRSALSSIARALLFPQYTTLSRVRNKYARCTDLKEEEYIEYIEFLDNVFAYLAAQAYTQRVKEGNK